MQTITTSVDDVDEIQIVKTSATPSHEVQSITVSPIPGESSLNSVLSYTLKLDTTAFGGSIEFSGKISATAESESSPYSLSEMLGAMKNIASPVTVTKSGMNPDGGHTYWVTFPTSMKDLPQMEVHLSDVPVVISTIENPNLLRGYFLLEYSNEVTDPISYDASKEEMQNALEMLDSIGKVQVSRSDSDEQDGYSWTIRFLSEINGGNLDDLIVHPKGLTSTNTTVGGATVQIAKGGTNGSFIEGHFVLVFSEWSSFSYYSTS